MSNIQKIFLLIISTFIAKKILLHFVELNLLVKNLLNLSLVLLMCLFLKKLYQKKNHGR